MGKSCEQKKCQQAEKSFEKCLFAWCFMAVSLVAHVLLLLLTLVSNNRKTLCTFSMHKHLHGERGTENDTHHLPQAPKKNTSNNNNSNSSSTNEATRGSHVALIFGICHKINEPLSLSNDDINECLLRWLGFFVVVVCLCVGWNQKHCFVPKNPKPRVQIACQRSLKTVVTINFQTNPYEWMKFPCIDFAIFVMVSTNFSLVAFASRFFIEPSEN